MIGRTVLFILLFTLIQGAVVANDVNQQPIDERVLIQLYYQTLCPYCIEFVTSQLKPLLSIPNIWKIAQFRLVPFGNGNVSKLGINYSFTCQFGQAECQGNIIENCALNLYSVEEKALPFVVCLEESQKNWSVDGPKCAQKFGINYDNIKSCTNSMYGRHWQYQAALQTKFLNIRQVPYIMINGIYDQSKQRAIITGLLKTICTNYKGSVKLPQCV